MFSVVSFLGWSTNELSMVEKLGFSGKLSFLSRPKSRDQHFHLQRLYDSTVGKRLKPFRITNKVIKISATGMAENNPIRPG